MPLTKPARGLQLSASCQLSRDLIFCALFNEATGSRAQDVSGHKAVGNLVGNTTWSPALFGASLKFDGSGDYVSFATKDWMVPGKVTVLAWVNPAGVEEVNHYVVSKGTSYFLDAMRALSGWDYPHFYISADSATSSKKLTAGVFGQLVGTYDGAVIRIYLNGQLTGSTNSAVGIPASTKNLYVGVNEYATGGFNGCISHVMIWKRALSAAEIAFLYREPFYMFEGKVSPGLLLAPAGQIVSLAGTCAAGTDVTASLKVTYRCAGAIAAQSAVSASLTVLGQVALAGAIAAHSGLSASLTVVGQVPPAQEFFAGSLNIEQDWLVGALFGGMTANAFKLGTVLSLGWFWMRRSGCTVLYRGPTMDQIDFTNALTVAEQDAGQISPPLYVAHGSSSTYFYAVRRVNTCGYREHTLAAVAKVAIDADGNLAAPQPNNIFAAAVRQVNGNKVRLTWFYCPLRQKSKPMCFRIYHDAASGQVDYQNPIGTITYQGQRFYSYLTGPLAGGRYLFAIRAEDADGVQNGSLARSTIQLVTEIPEAVDILSAESL
jgi:hypothetical protein